MEEDLPVSLPREKEKQNIISQIDFKWIVALIITILVSLSMYSRGAFVNVPKNTWYVLGGLIIALGYLLFSKVKPKSVIGMDKARKIAKEWIKYLQTRKEIDEGVVTVTYAMLRKNRGVPTEYYVNADVEDLRGKKTSYVVGVDAYSGDCNLLDVEIGGTLKIRDTAKRDIAPIPVVVKRGMTPETEYTEYMEED